MNDLSNKKMRILIGYDGSIGSNAMLDDLRRAGLPADTVAEIVTVAETWFPLPVSLGGVDTDFAQEAYIGLDTAKAHARHAQDYLTSHFPNWEIGYVVASGSPVGVLLGRADEWKPDLIVLGWNGHSALGGLLLGNVAQKIANEAHCSVRVARGRERDADAPLKLILGIDGSPDSGKAIAEVAERNWPPGTQVRIVNALWKLPPPSPDVELHENMVLQIHEWVKAENARISAMVDGAAKSLRAKGLEVWIAVREDDPKRLLIAEADAWSADCIILGAKGHGKIERLLLGSVSATVAMRAPCTVEIVRK